MKAEEEEAPPPEVTNTTTPAERLISAYARPSFTRATLEAAADALRRHEGRFSFTQIYEGVAAVTAAVKDWPEDERLAYLPTAANFFKDDGWRKHPEEWQSRRAPRIRLSTARQAPPFAAKIDIGGRKPVVIDTSAAPASFAGYDPEIGF